MGGISGVDLPVRTIAVGIRELQRSASRVLRIVEEEGSSVLVSRHGRPLAILVPIDQAAGWALVNRPLRRSRIDWPESEDWIEQDGVRLSPEANEALEEAGPMMRGRLMSLAGRIGRSGGAFGRVALRIGSRWALIDFDGPERPIHVLAIDGYRELRTWMMGGDRDSVSLSRAEEP